MTLSSLSPNKEYYIYLKSVKVNYGVRYVSAASDFAYCRTTGAEDLSKAYRINLTARNIFAQDNTASTDSDGGLCTIDRAVDESGLNQYLEDGYPDTSNKSFPTYWLANKYSRASVPYDIFIDLFSVHSLDRLFVFSTSKPKYSVFAMMDFGYEWEYVGAMEHGSIPGSPCLSRPEVPLRQAFVRPDGLRLFRPVRRASKGRVEPVPSRPSTTYSCTVVPSPPARAASCPPYAARPGGIRSTSSSAPTVTPTSRGACTRCAAASGYACISIPVTSPRTTTLRTPIPGLPT
jgi:hypothetical protein